MAYLKPPAFTRNVFNPIAMKLGVGGSETLSVLGRHSGQTRRVPIVPVDVNGARYAVSARGETERVRNLRRNPDAELQSKSRVSRFHAVELPVEECQPILQAYRSKAGRTVSAYFTKLPEAADHPVFRLDPIGA